MLEVVEEAETPPPPKGKCQTPFVKKKKKQFKIKSRNCEIAKLESQVTFHPDARRSKVQWWQSMLGKQRGSWRVGR